MADTHVFYDEIRINIQNEAFTDVYVFVRAYPDPPFNLPGWHYKQFPGERTSQDIVQLIFTGQDSPMAWERRDPPAMNALPILHPADCVPVPVELLQRWRGAFAAWGQEQAAPELAGVQQVNPTELANQVAGFLTRVPEWEKSCPHCRAYDLLARQQRGEPSA